MGAKVYTATVATLKPDPIHGSLVLSKFINCIMYDGKKATAQRAVYGAFDIIAKKLKDQKPMEIFETALNNVKPVIETKSRRVGGQNYQVPVAVNRKRQQALAFRWIIEAARSKSGKPLSERLADELMAAARKEGSAVTTRENVHKMAEANRAFAHFAF